MEPPGFAAGNGGNSRYMDEPATFSYAVDDRLDALLGMRFALRRWLSDVRLDSEAAEDIVLAAWEVCVNAVEHAVEPRGGVTLVASRTRLGVRIAVHDSGTWREHAVQRPGRGLGLRLTRAVMDRVSILRDRPGTEVVMWRFTGGRV
jgi:anti-sigma regulatory factor (Ser/Thr protein kinase)